jgi:hypothetical protein
MKPPEIEQRLLHRLTDNQAVAVKSRKRRVLVVAGAGSGKTEVMARRIAWWVGMDGVPKEQIVAFTFTERAAEEMKFRIRSWIQRITDEGEDTALGDMYIGTIHGFCIKKIREFWPNEYHNYDILDEAGRTALILRSFTNILALHCEIIADNLSKSGWSWGCISALNCDGRTIWIADAHRGDGKRFVVRADEKLTAFLELEVATRAKARVFSFLNHHETYQAPFHAGVCPAASAYRRRQDFLESCF